MPLKNLLKSQIIASKNQDADYDCVVLFSGGKDSSYLAHYLRSRFNLRVCLFSVDNGFEDMGHVTETARKLELDLYLSHPSENKIIEWYRYILSEQNLTELDSNPLCYLCNQYFVTLGKEFANNNHISIVINAVTLSQIFNVNLPISQRLLNVAQTLIASKKEKDYLLFQKYTIDSPVVRQIINRIYMAKDDILVINPFLYMDYRVDEIKSVLIEECDWQNPERGMTNQQYISAGCRLTKLFGLLHRDLGYRIHEYDQFRLDYEKKSIDEITYNHGVSMLDKLMSQDITSDIETMMKELQLTSGRNNDNTI